MTVPGYSLVSQKGRVMPHLSPFGRNFMLADFMYNDSVIRKGDVNLMPRDPSSGMRLDMIALSSLINATYDYLGNVSISYGYISPAQSERRVRWKDPKKPSLHRWDKGAAVDICFHDSEELSNTPPAYIAMALYSKFSSVTSRMITYSESPYVCIATAGDQKLAERNAVYFNSYEGVHGAKPGHIRPTKRARHSLASCHINADQLSDLVEGSLDILATQTDDLSLEKVKTDIKEHGWKGQGHPSYHLNGARQVQHIRLGRNLMLKDILPWIPNIVDGGEGKVTRSNRPPANPTAISKIKKLSTVLDRTLTNYYESKEPNRPRLPRVSILSAYKGYCGPSISRLLPSVASYHSEYGFLPWTHTEGLAVLAVHNTGYPSLRSAIDRTLGCTTLEANEEMVDTTGRKFLLVRFG